MESKDNENILKGINSSAIKRSTLSSVAYLKEKYTEYIIFEYEGYSIEKCIIHNSDELEIELRYIVHAGFFGKNIKKYIIETQEQLLHQIRNGRNDFRHFIFCKSLHLIGNFSGYDFDFRNTFLLTYLL